MSEIRDATAHMTLGQIRKRDEDNLMLVMKASKEHAFDSLKEADAFTFGLANKIYIKFGVDARKIALSLRPVVNRGKIRIDSALGPAAKIAAKKVFLRELNIASNKHLETYDVKEEHRPAERYGPKDAWKAGVYFYHHNEIAYWISIAYRRKGGHYATPHIIVPAFGKWFVLTNFKE